MRIAFLSDNYSEDVSKLDPFRFELLKEFARRADQFIYVQCTDYLYETGEFRNGWLQKRFLKRLKEFKPDLVFSLNRSGLNPEVIDSLKCQVYSWFIDNPNRFSKNLRTYAKNETVFCATRYMMNWVSKNVSQPVKTQYLPFCSNTEIFTPGELPQGEKFCDVSFVGTIWDPSHTLQLLTSIVKSEEDKIWLQKSLDRYVKDYDFPIEKEIGERLGDESDLVSLKNRIDDLLSTRSRLQILGGLTDFDIEIYGTRSWCVNALMHSDNLLKKISLTPIQSPEDLARLYRRSRICLSISHQQAQTGFPIRIFDILGCGTPLVSDRHSELSELFEEGRSFLAYESAEEARECVLRILNDPNQAAKMRNSACEEIHEKHSFSARVGQILSQSAVTCDPHEHKVEILSERYDPGSLAAQGFRIQPSKSSGSSGKARNLQKKIEGIVTSGSFFLGQFSHIISLNYRTMISLFKFIMFYRRPARGGAADVSRARLLYVLFKPLGRVYIDVLDNAYRILTARLNQQKHDEIMTKLPLLP